MSFFRRAGALIARFFTSAADPAAAAGEFPLYSKSALGVSQLFGRSDDGTVHQITPVTDVAVIFDDSVPGTNSNIRSDRAVNQSPIDNTRSQITNLGSQDGLWNGAAYGATGIASTIGGGDDNSAGPADYATVGGGAGNVASGFAATVPGGAENTAKGDYSVAEGFQTTANGGASHAEGSGTLSNSAYAHAEGDQTTASGAASHAEGALTTASGDGSHAEGISTQATARGAHAEGASTAAFQEMAHAEGDNTTAAAGASHSQGLSSYAQGTGIHAHACGSGTSALDLSLIQGSTQNRVIEMTGQTPGAGAGETVELDFGYITSSEQFTFGVPLDDMGYTIVVTAIARGMITGVYCSQSFRQMFSVLVTGGVATLEASGTLEQIGSAAAAPWTLVGSIAAAPTRFSLAFSTGATTSRARISAKVESIEIYNPV